MSPVAVAVLAKAPLPGFAKTRLAAGLGACAAARLQRCFTVATVRAAQAAALGPVRLWCAPDTRHRSFRALHAHCGAELAAQPPGDLGQRLLAAARHHFAATPSQPLLIVGTDCPLLSSRHLQHAAQALDRHDVVLIPAEDGGYVLIGLRRLVPGVFSGVPWSTPQVLAHTRERLAAAGARWCELAPLWDVDTLRDWQRLQALTQADGPVSIARRGL